MSCGDSTLKSDKMVNILVRRVTFMTLFLPVAKSTPSLVNCAGGSSKSCCSNFIDGGMPGLGYAFIYLTSPRTHSCMLDSDIML